MDLVLEQIENKSSPENERPNNTVNGIYTQNALIQVVSNYIPYQNIPFEKLCSLSESTSECAELENEGVEILENLLKNGDQSLKQFGTAEELVKNLRTYRSFTGNYERFGLKTGEPYNHTIFKYYSLSNKKYINKRNVFHYIFNLLMIYQPMMLEETVSVMVMIILKSYESRLSECCEFISHDSKELQNLSAKLIRDMTQAQHDLQSKAQDAEVQNLLAHNRLDKILPMFLDFLGDPADEETAALREVFQRNFPRIKKEQLALKMFIAMSSMVRAINQTVATHSRLLLPFSETRDPESVISVRVFEDDSGQFVIKSELFNAINIRDPAKYPLRALDLPGMYQTMSTNVDGEFSSFNDRIKDIEFIRVPIQKTKHAAVPIPAPNSGHCIPAADAFLELLRPLIFNRKIFQKVTKETWFNLRALISRLESVFVPETKRKFLVDVNVVDQLRSELRKFCDPYDKMPAKNVRDVADEGFTSEDLKNELDYLGFKDLFPEIQDHSDPVHKLLAGEKKGAVLKTSDLYNAVEKCVIVSVLERFPTLKLFIHHQEECERFSLKCERCTNQRKVKNSKWTEYTYNDVIPVYSESDPANPYFFKLVCGMKMVLTFNFKFFTEEEIKNDSIKYFGMSQSEAVDISEKGVLKQEHKDSKIATSLTEFLKFNNERPIFVRAIPSTQSDSKKRVFVQEILEVLRFLSEQNETKTEYDASSEKLKTLEKLDNGSTISLMEFEYLCEDLGVDKSRITIVPDPVYEVAVHQVLTVSKNEQLKVFGVTGSWIVRNQQAVFYIFQQVVCDVNWSKNTCEKHQKCLTSLRKKIIAVMEEYIKFEEGKYVSMVQVEAQIAELKTHCYFQNRKNAECPLKKLNHLLFEEKILYSTFRQDCETFGLQKFMKSSSGPKNKEILVVVARNRYFVSFFQQFYDPLNFAINDAIINELKFKYTDLQIMKEDFSMCVIELPQKTSENFAVHITPRHTRIDKAGVKKAQSASTSDAKGKNEIAMKINDDPSDSEEIVPTKVVKQTKKNNKENQKENSFDEQVEENNQLRMQLKISNDVRSELAERQKEITEQNNALMDKVIELGTALEREKKRTPETDREIINLLRAENAEIRFTQESLMEANVTFHNNVMELEALLQREKEKVVLLKDEVIRVKADNRNYADEQNQLIDQSARLDIDLDSEKERVHALTADIRRLTQKHEVEVSDLIAMNNELQDHKTRLLDKVTQLEAVLENERKKKIIQVETAEMATQSNPEELSDTNNALKVLEESNIRLLAATEENNQLIQEVLEKAVSNTTCSRSSSMLSRPPSIVGEPETNPENIQAMLAQLQKTKDNFQEDEQIQMAREMVETLKNLANRPDVCMLATYELQQYEGRIREYCQSIEMTYQKLKKTKDASSLPRSPELPSFSERFMNQYCKYMDAL